MKSDEGMMHWVEVMIRAIWRETYFRGHDSGGLFQRTLCQGMAASLPRVTGNQVLVSYTRMAAT
jgi:hypothetical protein